MLVISIVEAQGAHKYLALHNLYASLLLWFSLTTHAQHAAACCILIMYWIAEYLSCSCYN